MLRATRTMREVPLEPRWREAATRKNILLSRGNIRKVIAFFVALNKTSRGSEDPLKSPEYEENSTANEKLAKVKAWEEAKKLKELQKPVNCPELDFKLGKETTPDMKVKKDVNAFVMGKDNACYSIFSKKPFAAEVAGVINLRRYDDNSVTKIEDIKSNEKKINRPVNPVTITKAGKYAVEIVEGEKVIARKVFTVTEDKKAEKKEEKK